MIAAINGSWDGTRSMTVATGAAQAVSASPGVAYSGSFQLRPWEDFVDDAACELRWIGVGGAVIGRATGVWEPETPNRWKTYRCEGTAPTGATGVSLAARFDSVYRGDVHFLDGASISRAGDGPGVPAPLPLNLLDPAQNDFESDLDGWVPQGNAALERSTEAASKGEASLKVTASSTDPIAVDGSGTVRIGTSPGGDGVEVRPGGSYRGSVRIDPRDTSSAAGRCELRWYRADGSILKTISGRSAALAKGRWTTLECGATAPTDAAYLGLRVHVARAPYGTAFYVDDAWVTDGSMGPTPAGSSTTAVAGTETTVQPTTTVPPTTAAPTTTPAATTTTTAAGGIGPRVANPQRVGRIVVTGSMTLSDVIVDSIVVQAGGRLTATNLRVTGSVVVLPLNGGSLTSLQLANSWVGAGLSVNTIDSAGNLYWGEVPVDVVISGSEIHHPQGDGSEHTEALAGFGMPRGARFLNTTFVQHGPFNGSATAVVNWHGADSVFDGCSFTWADGVAAYYTVYVEGRNNVVRSSRFVEGLAGYVYPNSTPPASYVGNVDTSTGRPITL